MPDREADERFEKKTEETREGGVKLDRVGDVKSADNILAHLKPGDKSAPADEGSPEGSKAADSLSKKFADRALSQASKTTDQLSAGTTSDMAAAVASSGSQAEAVASGGSNAEAAATNGATAPAEQLPPEASSGTSPTGGIGGIMGMVEQVVSQGVLKDALGATGLEAISQIVGSDGANAAGQPSKLDTAELNKATEVMKQMMNEMSEMAKDIGDI